MSAYVWVDAWQQQCCGDDFRVGSQVAWSAVPQDGPDGWVGLLLGGEWAEKVRFHEEHHSDDDESAVVLAGTVVSIREVTCRRVPQPQGSGQLMVPIAGSGMLHEVDVPDKWSAEPSADLRDHLTFDGWIVEVELEPPATPIE